MNYKEPLREDYDTEEQYADACMQFDYYCKTNFQPLRESKYNLDTIQALKKKEHNEIHFSNMLDDYTYNCK